MRYFRYKIRKPRGLIWELFSDLPEIQEKRLRTINNVKNDYGMDFEYSEEIIKSAVNGNINLDAKFNLVAYEKKCYRNDRIGKDKRRAYEDNIVEIGEEDREVIENSKYGLISLNDAKLANKESLDDKLKNLEYEASFEGYLDELFSYRKQCLREYGIDPIRALRDACIDKIPEAVVNLQKIESKKIQEVIKNILISDKKGLLKSIFEDKVC